MSVKMVEAPFQVPEPVRPAAVLQQNRVFLDFFWDLAKPDQEVRLKAVENLVEYLKSNNKEDEMEYTMKRLVDGLAHSREAARPGFSLALGQVLSAFTDVCLKKTLGRIKEKHNLLTVKKKLQRNAMFGNLFGVLALHQSGRLSTEPEVVLGCVQLLQSLSQYRQHLKDLPTKTMMDILNEVGEDVFEEVLFGALKMDLASPFKTPEQLHLLLVALQRFPQTLKPKKLKKLLGFSTIINEDNVPRLTEVLKVVANSVKKERVLPGVMLDLLRLSLKEGSYHLFWNKVIIQGLLREPPGPPHYLCFRLLGSSLSFLSEAQLKEVMCGEVMLHYGEHVISSQKPGRFQLAPEMELHVSDFLQACKEPDRQLAVMVGFSSLTNQGYPVVSSAWRVVQHLQPTVLMKYVDWLKSMFLQPQMDTLLEVSKQKDRQDRQNKKSSICRFRKWISARLSSVIDNHQVKKEEDLIMNVSRFVFFHAFFRTKAMCADIPETKRALSVPLEQETRAVLANSFFGLLLSLHHLPLPEPSTDGPLFNQKRLLGVTADGTMWIHHLFELAKMLLSQRRHVESCQSFSPEQKEAWDSLQQSVEGLTKKVKKAPTVENKAFLQLFLLVGMHLFKAPEELVDIIKDLQSCVERAHKKKKHKKQDLEPEWVEVMVDILLSLLSQPSRHIRQVCRMVFSSICPHLTQSALSAILNVLEPEREEADNVVVVTEDDSSRSQTREEDHDEEEEEEHMEQDGIDSDDAEDDKDMDEDDDDDDDVDDENDEDVDPNFRLQLMKVLEQQNALAKEDDSSEEEELNDEAMMKLDKSLAAVFLEQKRKTQAKKDEKSKLKKEKALIRDFKIKVLDLVEVFVSRQASSPLILGLIEPLLTLLERGMSSDSEMQEQDLLRRAADILRNQLFRSKVYCRSVADRTEELHKLLEKLLSKLPKLVDSSVALYYFSASLYLVKVLRGAPPSDGTVERSADSVEFMGNVDVAHVCSLFKVALSLFLSRRKSALSTQMFTDLFSRFPVLCVKLLDTAVQHITLGIRQHQQGQACVLVLRAMQSREVQLLLSGAAWTELCAKVTNQLVTSLQQMGEVEQKAVKDKLLRALELCQLVLNRILKQKLAVHLKPLQTALQSLSSTTNFNKTGKLEDTYWAVMKNFGVIKPKAEKIKSNKEVNPQIVPKKKKGFLPESKKRRKRKASEATEKITDMETGLDGKEKKTKRQQPAARAASQASPAKKSKLLKKNKKTRHKTQIHGQG